MSLLEVCDLSHSFGDKVLYRKAEFGLYKGEHLGVTGQNGAGKSTLIGILSGEIIPERGSIKWQRHIRTGYLDQYAVIDAKMTVMDYLKTAFSGLFELEKKVNHLYERYSVNGDEKLLNQAADSQLTLESGGFYSIESRIGKVINGLGLTAVGTERVVGILSGGQRARIILAKLLLEQPDVLLLDEPTNFLDREHVDWLAEYLSGFQNAFIVVSHDFDFLERISTCICDIEAETIKKYHGKYSDFLSQKKHLRNDHVRQYNAQQVKIKQTEEFIRKNIAGVNSRIARGRRKHLERIERIASPSFISAKPNINFPEVPLGAQEVLMVQNLEVGYDFPLLPGLNFSVRGGEKVVITGFNGIGKSTLLKTLIARLPCISGSFEFVKQVKIGYCAQDLIWEDTSVTPLEIICDAAPRLAVKDVRRLLAQCGVKAGNVMQNVGTLSGGEQSKVNLCRMILSPSNFLILDEPTSHLDAESKESLKEALIRFGGSVLLVSHEEAFYRSWADRIFRIDDLVKDAAKISVSF